MEGGGRKHVRRTLLMQMGYSVYDKVRRRIAEDNNWRCFYCDGPVFLVPADSRDLATIDHRVPLARGGSWKRFNLICACRGCNEDKDNMTENEYRLYLMWSRNDTQSTS